MKNILLVGAGNLGSRHLQGIAKLRQPVNVMVVEPNSNAQEVARNRWHEVPSSELHTLVFANFEDIGSDVDLAIVATLAIDRFAIIKRLIELKVSHILCEKVAFQSVQLYQNALQLLSSSSTQIYLNYIYRMSDEIQQIKHSFQNKVVDLTVSAGDVELGCNLIHHLDLGTFLNNGAEITKLVIDDVEISNSNRRHHSLLSFYGVAKAEYANGAALQANLLNTANKDCVIQVSNGVNSYALNETKTEMIANGHYLQPFEAPRVSDTTTDFINGILANHCVLPSLADSFIANKLILDCLNMRVHKAIDPSLLCPIT
jgi:hypothetical protein